MLFFAISVNLGQFWSISVDFDQFWLVSILVGFDFDTSINLHISYFSTEFHSLSLISNRFKRFRYLDFVDFGCFRICIARKIRWLYICISGSMGRFRGTQSTNENAWNRVCSWANELESHDGSFRRKFCFDQNQNHS